MKTKKFTILHSNDIHGDFLAEVQGKKGELIGGLALLSGYINKVRKEEKKQLVDLKIEGKPVKDNSEITIALQGYHYKGCSDYLNISPKELTSPKGGYHFLPGSDRGVSEK